MAKKKMTTEEAFRDLIYRPNEELRELLAVSNHYININRYRFNHGFKSLTIDLMEKMLVKAGYKCVQEKIWKK